VTISIEDAQLTLAELIHRLAPGEEAIVTENERPVARIIATGPQTERKLGTLKGTVIGISDDFDAPLDEFKEYMQ
jgi:antitoxin (DNA-binding transcriptional repressor) of toxin-antitoxin stability system